MDIVIINLLAIPTIVILTITPKIILKIIAKTTVFLIIITIKVEARIAWSL
jgi:hypothetical protein